MVEKESTRRQTGEFTEALGLNPNFNFESFIVLGSNHRPYKALLDASKNDLSIDFNPLVIYGPRGSGKTHLLEAYCHGVLERTSSVVCYGLGEHFCQDVKAAYETRTMPEFLDPYERAETLVIDDVHRIAPNLFAKEKLVHIINVLKNRGARIVFSLDTHSFHSLGVFFDDSFRSWLRAGLTLGIENMTADENFLFMKETARRSLANLGSEAPSLDAIPDNVLDFAAQRLPGRPPELQGAVTQLLGYVALVKPETELDEKLAEQILAGRFDLAKTRVPFDRIFNIVSDHYGLDPHELRSDERTQRVAVPRQIIMYLARRNTGWTLEDIGKSLGRRDHSTVLYGVDRIAKKMDTDEDLSRTVADLEKRL